MDIILIKAKKFADNYLQNVSKYDELLSQAKSITYDIDDTGDKIKFLGYVLERNNSEYTEHLVDCRDVENCRYNYGYETVAYYLTQELNRLGVYFNEDTFTEDDKIGAESKLDQILKELADLKLGQQVLYDEILKELNELRDLYFLGKKKWYQLFIGKSVDMVASGIISETVSKDIINSIKSALPELIAKISS